MSADTKVILAVLAGLIASALARFACPKLRGSIERLSVLGDAVAGDVVEGPGAGGEGREIGAQTSSIGEV